MLNKAVNVKPGKQKKPKQINVHVCAQMYTHMHSQYPKKSPISRIEDDQLMKQISDMTVCNNRSLDSGGYLQTYILIQHISRKVVLSHA